MTSQDELGLVTCECCNKPVAYDLIIPDDAWARISPRPVDGWKGGGILCPECIVTSLIAERDGLREALECALDEHEQREGRIVAPESPHWSVAARTALSLDTDGLTQPQNQTTP